LSSGVQTEPSENRQNTQLIVSTRFDSQIDAAKTAFRLGIFGGTFDPIHYGHLHIAEMARQQFELDGVLFIPTGKPVHKAHSRISDVEDRYIMLLEAIAGNKQFDASRIEIDRGGTTYTIDTIRALHARYLDHAELFFIVGSDTAADINTWKDAGEIVKLVTILCAKRADSPDEEQTTPERDWGFDPKYIEASLIDISSHELRKLVQAGRNIQYLVPDAVCSYIQKQGLYQKSPQELLFQEQYFGEEYDRLLEEAQQQEDS